MKMLTSYIPKTLAGVTWKYIAFDISYKKSDMNMLYLTMSIGWPSLESEELDSKKIERCIKECVGNAFGVKVDNG